MGEFLSVSRLTQLGVLSLVLCASLIFVQLANAQPVQTGQFHNFDTSAIYVSLETEIVLGIGLPKNVFVRYVGMKQVVVL